NRGKGCPACNHTGYRGRLAIHEILPIDRTIKDFILQRTSVGLIQNYMKEAGYHTLVEDGLMKVLEGYTTTEEVLHVATVE
ncbi:MAG TPA: type II secretion system protein GspE, partial [Ureibacillus sp.]|nr:type II secretion system protein GspE [Ureibacillus sp.]